MREYGEGTDALWEYLEENKHTDRTLAIGWAIERAKRFFNLDQVQIAQRTEIRDQNGVVVGEPISKSFISAMLYGRSKVQPDNYKRLAEATQVNPLHFYIAEGWIDIGDTAAFELPDRDLSMPVIHKLMAIPEDQRPKARAVVLAVLDSIYAAQQAQQAEEPQSPNGGTKRKTTSKKS